MDNLNVRRGIRGLALRDVVFRPTVTGIGTHRSDIAYTLIHVHSLVDDSTQQVAFSSTGNEAIQTVPSETKLHQNYPNPFNPSTTIQYELNRLAEVDLRVFDLLGREILVLVDGPEEPGYHRVTLDATSLASGLYFYRLQAGQFIEVRKLLVVK